MSIDVLLQQIVNGLVVGSVYALVALGYTMVYGQWPYWPFFFNQVDDSIKILASCVCGADFPGGGAVEIDSDRLRDFLMRGFGGMNSLFDKHGFPEKELEAISHGVLEVIQQAGIG